MELQQDYQSKQEDTDEYIGSLISEGFYDKLVIIGFPYDTCARRCGVKGGHDYAPDSFRRFVQDIGSIQNPEYGIDISKGVPKISDYGNIQITGKPTYEELHDKLKSKVSLCIQRTNIPFIIGGTRDLLFSVSNAILKQNKNCLFILLRRSLDLNLDSEINQQNCLSHVLQNEEFKLKHKVMILGVEHASENQKDQLKSYCADSTILSIEDIRGSTDDYRKNKFKECRTQVGGLLNHILENAESNEDIDSVHISISMECIESVVGVSTQCTFGISTEEATEVCLYAGLSSKKLVSIDINDYNPFVEDWSTGRLVATMFYYFTLGLSTRLQQNNLQ